jgi:peptidoglycan/xylan/chitin deacetylase (PgdA/CDA1 family)
VKTLTDHGMLIISLDFELFWGVHDVMSLEQYRENLLGVRQAVPGMLELFQEYDIHATWATVGKLFFENKSQLLKGLPLLKPNYESPLQSGYRLLNQIGESEEEDPFHYAPSLIKQIASVPHQEIGTHTFSHYYCLEAGQTSEEFKADIQKAVKIGKAEGISIQSIVFPRNQVNQQYLMICQDAGLLSYRGNEISSIYQASSFHENQSAYKRILRLADAFVNLTGHHIYSLNSLATEPIINLPSSRFLRPYNPKLKFLENLRLKRITNSLTKAAKENKMYHLWWHPHNFGLNLKENLQFLSKIFTHYSHLKNKYGMKSYNMAETAALLIDYSKK